MKIPCPFCERPMHSWGELEAHLYCEHTGFHMILRAVHDPGPASVRRCRCGFQTTSRQQHSEFISHLVKCYPYLKQMAIADKLAELP